MLGTSSGLAVFVSLAAAGSQSGFGPAFGQTKGSEEVGEGAPISGRASGSCAGGRGGLLACVVGLVLYPVVVVGLYVVVENVGL